MSRAEILFVLTGSIACYKACQAISRLRADGYAVQTVVTEAALHFVGAATLEGVSGRPVARDLYAPGAMMEHIHLIRRADLVVVAPATANFINQAAAGIADDLACALFLAHRFDKPFLIAPAMNTAMYAHPATQASMGRLREWGIDILHSDVGRLACGEQGEGRLLEPDALVAHIAQRLAKAAREPTACAGKQHRIIVTAGGTQDPIDAVRVLTNVSTGQTGAALARYFAAQGYLVTLLLARGSGAPTQGIDRVVRFGGFSELAAALRDALADPQCMALIHAAAVSDYGIADADVTQKHPSDAEEWIVRFKRNPKLIDQVRAHAGNPQLRVVAFKLTANASAAQTRQAVLGLLERSGADYVVHNDLARIGDGRHPFTVYGRQEEAIECADLAALSRYLFGALSGAER